MQSAIKTDEETTPGSGWTEAQRFAVIEELRSILKDTTFNHSKRCMALLRWLVEQSLAQDCDGLKERTVGMAVFGRSADYDTNNDPIVRMAANEVRKRLAMYYQNPNARRSVVRIRLVPGSYIPEFDFHDTDHFAESEPVDAESADASGWDATASIAESSNLHTAEDPLSAPCILDVPRPEGSAANADNIGARLTDDCLTKETAPQANMASSFPKAHAGAHFNSTKRLLMLSAGVLLLAGAGWLASARMNLFHSSQYMAWAPLLASKTPPIICLSENIYLPPRGAEKHTAGGSASQLNSAPEDVSASAPPSYSYEDVNVAHKVTLWLTNHNSHLSNYGAQVSLRRPRDISLWEFRHQPVVLIGAADNLWASTLLASLRFTPRLDPVTGALSIHDSHNPAKLNFVPSAPTRNNPSVDYAIVTRYHDADLGNWIFGICGLGPHGTEAAGQLMIDPYWEKSFPPEVRSGKNFQIVVKTVAINGKTGIPQIVDFYAW